MIKKLSAILMRGEQIFFIGRFNVLFGCNVTLPPAQVIEVANKFLASR